MPLSLEALPLVGNINANEKAGCRIGIATIRKGEATSMTTTDDFRFHAHVLIVELDAATTEMMMLISAHQLNGPEWERVTQRQHDAYERWMKYLNERSYPNATEPSDNKPAD